MRGRNGSTVADHSPGNARAEAMTLTPRSGVAGSEGMIFTPRTGIASAEGAGRSGENK